jgi:erythromycin esterase-like protein
MDKLNITPKPWHVMRGDVLDQHGRMVAAVDSFDTDDARLIAAAPELLEALQDLVHADTHGIKNCSAQVNALEKAKSAIDKALGK